MYILVSVALIFAILAFSYCQYVAEPKFSATGSVIVTNGSIIKGNTSSFDESTKVNTADIQASLQLANTIIDVLKTNQIYKELSESFNDKYTYSQLISCSTINRRSEQTLFIDVTFSASSKEEAKKLTNKFLELAPSYINQYIPHSGSAVTTTADNAQKTYPRTGSTTLFAGIIGVIIAYALIYLIHIFNNTIKNEEDIKENYNLIIIGDIPDFTTANSKGYYKYNSYVKGGGKYVK